MSAAVPLMLSRLNAKTVPVPFAAVMFPMSIAVAMPTRFELKLVGSVSRSVRA